ncbi:MAG: ABC transporter ATP-binding protein [Clostridia bacterium]
MAIIIENLTKAYSENVVFDNFSFTACDNLITCILGKSGCGKTTLLNCIANLETYFGAINTEGNTSYIFQQDRLVPTLNIADNLQLVLKTPSKEKIEEMLKKIDLYEHINKFPSQLSGGMRQRVAIARAFLFDSKNMLMDEPFKALDISIKNVIIKMFLELWQEKKQTVLYVTHDIEEALKVADRIVVLANNPCKIKFDKMIQKKQAERNIYDDFFNDLRKELYSCFD